MRFVPSWKLSIALAAVALLAAFAAWPGVITRDAEATVDSLAANANLGDDGSTITITVQGDPDAGNMDLTTNSDETFTLVECETDNTTDCDAAVTGGGGTLTLNTAGLDDDYTLIATMTLNCDEPESFTVSANDADAGSASLIVFCVEELNDPHLVVEKEADDDDIEYDFSWNASNGDCVISADDGTLEIDDNGSFELEDNDQALFWCEDSVRLTVVEDDDDDFTEIEDCSENTEGVEDISGASVEIDISDIDEGDTVFCTFVNEDGFAPTATAAVGNVATVAIFLSAGQVNCGQSVLVQVVPRSASGGPVAAGTTISVNSSLGGSFSPSGSITSAFPVNAANFLFTAPANVDGITTITARAGNVQTSVNLRIVCQLVAPPLPTATLPPLSPPSAGDGGLAATSSGGSYLPSAIALAVAAAVLGLAVYSRRLAAVRVDGRITPDTSSPGRPGGLALVASLAMLAVALLMRRRR